MELKEVSLPLSNKITAKYINGEEQVGSFFDYFPLNSGQYERRKHDLSKRSFPREALANYLKKHHEQHNADKKAIENIERLKSSDSLVVIGGQQAGLLTGPLYTIHKIISILKLSKQQEEKLGVPVLPVFWIAGEDHDFDEINHVYVPKDRRMDKVKINQKLYKKEKVSNIKLDHDLCLKWVNTVFESFGETEFTNKLMKDLEDAILNSNTYVDFFIRVVLKMFGSYGLIVLDSGDEKLREIESPFLEQLVKENHKLSNLIYKQQVELEEMGYGKPIEINKNNAHLFLDVNQERVLLERNDQNQFYGKNNECLLTKDELIEVAKSNPERLSNNVVTRPLMQEYLFPTIAFVGGPGEIAYWSTLRQAFHLFNFTLPPLVSRLTFTFVERKIENYLDEMEIELTRVLEKGVLDNKEEWLKGQVEYNIDEIFALVTNQLNEAHKPLQELAVKVDRSLSSVADKNRKIIDDQLSFLKNKIERSIRSQLDGQLRKFDDVDRTLKPLGIPQERVWNVFYYLNKFGPDFIDRVMELEFELNNDHKIIFI